MYDKHNKYLVYYIYVYYLFIISYNIYVYIRTKT